MYCFALGQIPRTDQCEYLHDGRALSRMWVSPVLGTITLGVSTLQMRVKNVFRQFVFHIVIGLCHKQDPLMRGCPCFTGSCL